MKTAFNRFSECTVRYSLPGNRNPARLGLICALVLGLGACVSIPDTAEPVEEALAAAQWLEAEQEERDGQPVEGQWWTRFDDPTLDRLIDAALNDGFDIRQSQARLREAYAVGQQVRSGLWPVINGSGSYTWTEQSVNSPNGPSSLIQAGFIDRQLEFWGAGLSAQWDLDLFGGNRFANQSSLARREASRAALNGTRLATVSQVALGYVDYVTTQRRLDILRNNVDAQEQSLALLNRRFSIGLENRLNIDRASGELASVRSRVPLLEAQRLKVIYQMAVLTTLSVEQVSALLGAAKPLPLEKVAPAVGAKSALLNRRPDVTVAQYQLYAASAEVGQARADLFPKVIIGATTGLESGTTGTLLEGASRTSALAPALSFPVFNRGRLKAASEAALARYERALAEFEQTVTRAFTDAETRLLDLDASRQSAMELERAASSNRDAAERAEKLYQRGLLSYLDVLDARRQKLGAEDAAVQAQAARDAALLNLYIALGGGWQVTPTGVAELP